jgi:hypothetical protein
MNARLKGFSEEVDLETEETQHFLVFETDSGKKFSTPVSVETIQAIIQELNDKQAPEPEERAEEEEDNEQQPETDFDKPPDVVKPVTTGRVKLKTAPPKPAPNELDITPVDIPEGASVFGDEPEAPTPFELHDNNTQRSKLSEEAVPAL